MKNVLVEKMKYMLDRDVVYRLYKYLLTTLINSI